MKLVTANLTLFLIPVCIFSAIRIIWFTPKSGAAPDK